MKERRRGLGRGLGALIPTSSEGERPVDVFFPAAASAGGPREAGVTTIDPPEDGSASEQTPVDVSRETSAGDAAEATREAIDSAGDTAHALPAGADKAQFDDATPAAEADSVSDESPESTTDTSDPDGTTTGADVVDDKSQDAPTSGEASQSDGAPVESVPPDSVAAAFDRPDAGGDVERAETTAAELGGTGPDEAPASATVEGTSRDGGVEAHGADDSAGPATGEARSADEQGGLVPVPGASFAELPVNSIRPNPRQPRTVFDEGELDELVGSIREIGVLQPVVVRPAPDEAGQFELIMGERRWRATQAAGLDVIPAIVRVTDDEDLLRDALLENLHRSALNPLEEAAAYRQLLDDFGCTHDELATRISRSRPQISNTLRLLRLPPLVQRRVAAGVLSAGHARALLGLSDGAAIERLAQRIVSEGLSVRATEEIVALGVGEEKAPQHRPRAGQRSEAVDELASRLSDRFETRVRVDLGKSKGKVTIEFASVEDLNRILDVMAPEDPGLLRR